MDRRSAIRCYLAVSAGIVLLPSCLQDKSKSSIGLKNIDLTGEQENLLANLAETIIPKTTTPGAKDLSAHLFAMTMVDDCYDKDAQRKFVNGLAEFESMAKSRFSHSFVTCTQPQKEELLKAMEGKDGASEAAVFFYHTMKKLTIQSFVTSRYFLTKIQVYELVPSRFHGCVAVTRTN